MVHGNHISTESSEIDYDYLCKILSSGPEMIARALIILEILKQLRLWNTQTMNPFYKQLDLLNIGLMGHSHAGEAIVVAYILNKLKFVPEHPTGASSTDYGFGIKALFSISGIADGYMLLGRSLEIYDVWYT
ncbi:unnamed protein product [Rotaria sordida]|uniref:Uncharacterized protein n=1 Tax=Rotaria sordida TaxID=392033 RepID=A0A815UPM8_9BILA|nr:unnamed protein product [Rotaria sordida]CAF1520437.1 unnamed protein product [Rotaria sordida]CAF1548166.1 unnamed protein product [Rotaria sordida]CAF4125190.1 unnamed protein product [Rotaria sordida]CAF4219138.1 unnamed protein product [Rotaria sordida]